MSVAVSSEKLGQPKDVSGLSQYFFHRMSCKGCWHQLHWQPPIFLSFVDIEVKVVHQEDMDKFVAVFTAMYICVGTNNPFMLKCLVEFVYVYLKPAATWYSMPYP